MLIIAIMLRTKFARVFPRSSVKLFPRKVARMLKRSSAVMCPLKPARIPPNRSQDKSARALLPTSALSPPTSSATMFPSSCATWSTRKAVKMFPRSSAPPCPSSSAGRSRDRSAKLHNQLMEENSNTDSLAKN